MGFFKNISKGVSSTVASGVKSVSRPLSSVGNSGLKSTQLVAGGLGSGLKASGEGLGKLVSTPFQVLDRSFDLLGSPMFLITAGIVGIAALYTMQSAKSR